MIQLSIARFISADSKIPEPGMSQAYNRYVYTIGNPVKYTDPDGHWYLFAAGLVMYLASQTIVEDPQLAQAMAIAGVVMMGAGAGGVTGLSGGATAAAANGALVGGTMGFLNSGGAIIEGAKGAVIGGVTGAATYNIGHGSGGNHVAGSNVVAQAATHGVVQGVISEASGGNFRTGFIGGATGHVAGKATQGVMQGDTTGPAVAARTSIAAIFGGTAAHVTGGNFGQGAYHAAMVHLFNGEMGSTKKSDPAWPTDHHKVTSEYSSSRVDPVTGKTFRPHTAIDIKNPHGDPVHSILDGKVVAVGSSLSAGNYIKIDHGNGLETSYSHTNSVVSVGDSVVHSQIVGSSDSSGRIRGPHLHFVTRQNGERVNPCTVVICP